MITREDELAMVGDDEVEGRLPSHIEEPELSNFSEYQPERSVGGLNTSGVGLEVEAYLASLEENIA